MSTKQIVAKQQHNISVVEHEGIGASVFVFNSVPSSCRKWGDTLMVCLWGESNPHPHWLISLMPSSSSSIIPWTKCQGNVTLIIIPGTPGPIISSPLSVYIICRLQRCLSLAQIRFESPWNKIVSECWWSSAEQLLWHQENLFACNAIYVTSSQLVVVVVVFLQIIYLGLFFIISITVWMYVWTISRENKAKHECCCHFWSPCIQKRRISHYLSVTCNCASYGRQQIPIMHHINVIWLYYNL